MTPTLWIVWDIVHKKPCSFRRMCLSLPAAVLPSLDMLFHTLRLDFSSIPHCDTSLWTGSGRSSTWFFKHQSTDLFPAVLTSLSTKTQQSLTETATFNSNRWKKTFFSFKNKQKFWASNQMATKVIQHMFLEITVRFFFVWIRDIRGEQTWMKETFSWSSFYAIKSILLWSLYGSRLRWLACDKKQNNKNEEMKPISQKVVISIK